jgi:uncharacterized lipoprotein YmbA
MRAMLLGRALARPLLAMPLLAMPLLAMPALLAGCASPSPSYFTLAAVPGDSVTTGPLRVELRQLGLAGYLDRPEIVRSTSGYQVALIPNARWGEPTGGMIERVFTEDLVRRLPEASVVSETGAISTTPDRVVEIDLQRLDTDASGEVVLLAQVAVRHETGAPGADARTYRLTARPASDSTRDLVAAESHLLGELADRVAATLAE